MKPDRISFAARPLLFFAIAATLVCAGSSTVRAQGSGSRPPQPRQPDLTRREHQIGALERETGRKREPAELLAEVNEDMGRLKTLSEEISAQAAATDEQLNYKFILGHLVEINKRATRLGTDLALPPAEKGYKPNIDKDVAKGALQPALLALNKLLDGFLNNPIFSDTGAVDLHLAAKARGDLDEIIVLSDKLRKSTDKRSKAGVKSSQ